MLKKIINAIKNGNISSITDLCEIVDASPEIVKMMVEDLVGRGYLKEVNIGGSCSCGSSCKGCAGCNHSKKGGLVFWELTEKADSIGGRK
ncbi:MAG: FeoC-like transcriptional regulator [Spirochaetales bacterium]|nr:FeoC-like transcriptional regulator [Spirochaetales bacterium]